MTSLAGQKELVATDVARIGLDIFRGEPGGELLHTEEACGKLILCPFLYLMPRFRWRP